MRTFEYARPSTVEAALELLNRDGACVLSGGTDLMVRMRRGQALPSVVVDLKRAAGLERGIVESDAGLRVGALCVMADIVGDARVWRWFPALGEAGRVVGSVQIRNRATLAGNICNASPAADTAPALLIYGAVVNLIGAGGRRSVAVGDFFTGPGRTALRRGEIVESIDLPRPVELTGSAFGRVTRRRGVDLATINLCCLVTASGETRFAFGAVGPRPFLAQGADLDEAIAQASPRSDVRGSREYRLAMLRVMGRRAMRTALERLLAGA